MGHKRSGALIVTPVHEPLRCCCRQRALDLKSKGYKLAIKGTVPLYYKVVNYLLEIYATVDIFEETDAYMTQFTQLSNNAPQSMPKNFGTECSDAKGYMMSVLKGNFSRFV